MKPAMEATLIIATISSLIAALLTNDLKGTLAVFFLIVLFGRLITIFWESVV